MNKIIIILAMLVTVAFSLPLAADSGNAQRMIVAKNDYHADNLLKQLQQSKKLKAKVRYKSRKKVVKKRKKRRLAKRSKRRANQNKISRIINQDFFNPSGPLKVSSAKAIVINQITGETVYAKNNHIQTPIASVTKLMTAMVALDALLPMHDQLMISHEDIDNLKGTRSRLKVGTMLSRQQLLHLALMSSENRAASALSRHYPGGRTAFIQAMNTKAAMLGMQDTYFVDATGLNSNDVSTATDLVKLVGAAHQYDEIRQHTTTTSDEVYVAGRHKPLKYVNTNALVRSESEQWQIGLSKTGFINEAGRCLVMQADIAGEPMIIVLLDSSGKYTRLGDANRIRKWFEYNQQQNQQQNQEVQWQAVADANS